MPTLAEIFLNVCLKKSLASETKIEDITKNVFMSWTHNRKTNQLIENFQRKHTQIPVNTLCTQHLLWCYKSLSVAIF